MTVSTLARTLAAAPCVVHFVKADGTARRMLTAPAADGVTAKPGAVRVFDAEKGAWRSICAERVVSVTPVRARVATRPAAPAARVAAIVTDDDFGGGFVSTRAHAAARRVRV